MNKIIYTSLVLTITLSLSTFSQPFSIGQISATYTDPDRNNRSVPTQIFYPAVTSGSNVPVSEGEFPVIVFGHGFVMVYSAYQFLWEALVPLGYIVALPTTEGSFSPNHLALGLDLRFLINKLKSEGNDPSSLLYGHVADSSAIMGHSMGGGAAFLACENFPQVSTLVTFAAAETNPSAIQAAQNITVPTLVFSGSNDCVTPPPNHQIPMYDNLASDCKTFVSITGGGHCYFANYNFNCAFGESTCSPSPTISRAQQHAIILDHLVPYFDYLLKGNTESWITINNLLNNPSGITSSQECNLKLFDLKVLLEGPFDNGLMNTSLNSQSFLPLSQPYQSSPWNYPGQESVSEIPAGDVVDWLLIELRDAVNASSANLSSVVARKAAFIDANGSIIDHRTLKYPRFDIDVSQNLFVVLKHRNHLPLMSAFTVAGMDGLFEYDFTTDIFNSYGGLNSVSGLSGGKFGMIAGDIDANGVIDSSDKTILWESQSGTTGYLRSDIDLDGQTDNPDKNDLWRKNLGKSSQLPD
ncbi:MAG: alpha/beta hydrolase family protein [Bacteroidales bacterium]